MSLAMYAAPFDDSSMSNNNNNEKDDIYKKKQTHNKTQKKYPKEGIDHAKVNSVLQSIHNHSGMEEEDSLGDFYPPPNPQSAGVQKTMATEQMLNMGNNALTKSLGLQPQPNYIDGSDNLELNNFSTNYGDSKSNEEYYRKFIPNYPNTNNNPSRNHANNKRYYTDNNSFSSQVQENSVETDVLLQKINYMINLLEEKQDEKTNNVTEEIILYSFLGIFIIFIVDSFTRVGKYVR